MHVHFILFVVSLCSALFCSITVAQAGGEETAEASTTRIPFSSQEDEFINEEVIFQAQTYGTTSWALMAKKHELKVKDNDLGFTQNRSAPTIRKHFDRFLKDKIPTWKPSKTAHGYRRYSKQEEEFINKELLNDEIHPQQLFDDSVWRGILEKHNLKRNQKCRGFSQERSLTGLRSHFRFTMKPKKQVTKEVMDRYPRVFKTSQGSTSYSKKNKEEHPDQDTDPSENTSTAQTQSGAENEVFESILRDLKGLQNSVDEHGIDHSLFVGKGSSRNYPSD